MFVKPNTCTPELQSRQFQLAEKEYIGLWWVGKSENISGKKEVISLNFKTAFYRR